MRPLRLELKGFTSFREHTEVDFEGTDYFALVGSTGAGKSTIIDAVCFALYGSVPRYAHQGLVAPVISQGQIEAKVRLDFAVEDATYTAVRVVRRSGKGATTKEARLQLGDEVLAGNADEVTEAVTKLIGLNFEHFTKCVVLPQGEFARFLHDKPAGRQDLLIRLLNLGIYDAMRQAASGRAMAAKARMATVEDRLTSDLAMATPEVLKEAKARIKSLKALRKKVDASLPKLDSITKEATEAENEAVTLSASIVRLQEVRIPVEVEALADEAAAATKILAEAAETLATARTRVADAAASHAVLPDPVPLNSALDGRRRELELTRTIEEVKARAGTAGAASTEAEEARAAAESALQEAKDRLAALEHQHLAHKLSATLEAGGECPVCLQPVKMLPKHQKPKELAAAQEAVTARTTVLATASNAQAVALQEEAAIRGRLDTMTSDVDKLALELEGLPDAVELQVQLDRIAQSAAALEAERKREQDALAGVEAARGAVEALRSKEKAAGGLFEDVRLTLAELGPPQPQRGDLADDWEQLASWAAARVPELEEALTKARGVVAAKVAERDALISQLGQSCADCEVELESDNVLEAVVTAQTDAARDAETIAAAIESAAAARSELAELQIIHQRAHGLAEHLSGKAGRFESWIVNEALRQLVIGATEVLHTLSGEKYALTIDDSNNFLVVDHDNADETRPVKTLSGGETFLASLALALALADQLAELAAEGAAHLDAIFLDEGFGTLDPDSLDTVAAAVETLASGGRMVGIVTHVPDLAERVPIQYRVTKTSAGSRVEKVVL